jgi:HAD superfamily hydrolase (TIGR01509 family)
MINVNIKLVMFDLDGVLVVACEWHRLALNDALKEVCNYEISLEDHHSMFNGIPTKVKLLNLLEKGLIEEKSIKIVEDLKQIKTVEIINKLAFHRDEKIEIINFLKNEGIKVACYTNSIRLTAELMLKKTGIFDLFDLVISNQDVTKPKPDPEGYLKCLEFFNIDPQCSVIIEDSENGIQAAKKTKAKIWKVNNPDDVTKDNFIKNIVLI